MDLLFISRMIWTEKPQPRVMTRDSEKGTYLREELQDHRQHQQQMEILVLVDHQQYCWIAKIRNSERSNENVQGNLQTYPTIGSS